MPQVTSFKRLAADWLTSAIIGLSLPDIGHALPRRGKGPAGGQRASAHARNTHGPRPIVGTVPSAVLVCGSHDPACQRWLSHMNNAALQSCLLAPLSTSACPLLLDILLLHCSLNRPSTCFYPTHPPGVVMDKREVSEADIQTKSIFPHPGNPHTPNSTFSPSLMERRTSPSAGLPCLAVQCGVEPLVRPIIRTPSKRPVASSRRRLDHRQKRVD